MVNAADCKSVLRQWRFESSHLKKFTGHSIIGNAFDLGLKDYRFKSCCPEKKRLSRIMVVWGSAKS